MATIYHEVFIAASAEKIYNALTSQAGLSAWWTPDTKAKPEQDSISRFTFGEGYYKEMKIAELKPFTQAKWSCIAGAEEWIGTSISFKLESGTKEMLKNSHPEIQGQLQQNLSHPEGTVLIFHHEDWKEYTPMFAECNYTWGQFLRSLKLFCETGKGRPWPHQHHVEL